MSHTDLELDEEAKALAEAINDTPEGDKTSSEEDTAVSSKPAKKGASKSMKLMLGGAALLVLAMGGAFVAQEMGVGQPPKKVKPAGPPPLLDDKPVAAQAPAQAPAEPAAQVIAPTAQVIAPTAQVTAPTAQAPIAPAADPFKQAAPAQDDPFKQAAPAPLPVQETKPVEEVKVAPTTVAKDKTDVVVEKPKAHKKHVVKKHAPVSEPDNGYVRII